MTTALVPSSDEVKTIADRIKLVVPNGADIPPDVRLGVAQLAVIHGLDPFMGEIMAIKTKRGYVPYVGIEGIRRASRNQIDYQRVLVPLNDYWADEYYHMTADQLRQANGMDDQDIVWLCALYVDGQERPYVELGACGPGFPSVSSAPRWKIAKKRAEAAALKAACDLPFTVGGNGEPDAEPTVEGHVTVMRDTSDDYSMEEPYLSEAQFLRRVIDTIPYFSHPNHVSNTLTKLELEYSVQEEPALLEALNDYANKRANEKAAENGQAIDDAMYRARVQAEMSSQEPLFGPEDEEIPWE